MIVLDSDNTYSFSNAVIKIIDETYVDDDATTGEVVVQDFNLLIPTVQTVGKTNVLEYYQPGEQAKYLKEHGTPNALQYGFGPDLIADALSEELASAKVGIYHINLRGPSATMANIIVAMKYRVETDVPYTDTDGSQYYVDENGQLTTNPTNATPVSRDVLHVKMVTSNINDCKKWLDLHNAMNSLTETATPDEDGYYTIPWFAVMYRGATSYANDVYFHFSPTRAEYDGNIYYSASVFNGTTMKTSDPIFSFDPDSGTRYDTSYYIENRFNEVFPTLRFLSAEDSTSIIDLFNKYGYTLDDYLDNCGTKSSTLFSAINPFAADSFAIVMDSGSVDASKQASFRLSGGSDGTETKDELFQMFFNGEILGDITSPLRYHINYIPDLGYDKETKHAIEKLCDKYRFRMTTCTLMMGGIDGFSSALIEHQGEYYTDMPCVRQLARYQSPMRFNPYIKKTIITPGTYFDTMALLRHFKKWGNYFQPFAGAEARWLDYIEDTMSYPSETPQYLQALQNNRVNVVMKDSKAGGYLSDQQMDTTRISDQTELNNAFLISCMLYDLVDLVHYNHFKFNEAEELRAFNSAVQDRINEKYSRFSASLSATVSRVGTVGRARYKNQIYVRIDLKDINKFTDIILNLIDE